jgi:hypothetical protein
MNEDGERAQPPAAGWDLETPSAHRLIRIIFSSLNDIEEWKLGNPALAAAKGYPRAFPAPLIDGYGIVFLDLTVDAANGTVVCHEVNGPNAVGSDALTGNSAARAENEAAQTLRTARELGLLDGDRPKQQLVTLHAHQHWRFFRTGGEFYPRVHQYGELLERLLPGTAVCRRGSGEALGEEQVSVVVGDVPAVAAKLSVSAESGQFVYAGRPVVFIGNPNLLPELQRTGKLQRHAGGGFAADLRVFHAWRLAALIHDKARQQSLFYGTGIRGLRHFEAHSIEAAVERTRDMLQHGAVVLKPNGGSGGVGVHVVVPGMSDDDIRKAATSVLSDCRAKYGENAEATALPLRGFEFVRSTEFPMPDGGHLWDLRIAVLFEPGKAQAYPVSMRLTPDPFDAARFHLQRDQWISNVSGRQTTLLKSGLDDIALAAVGMTPERLEHAIAACMRWTLKAWDHAIRAGEAQAGVYEDACESSDPSFYPWEKFTA